MTPISGAGDGDPLRFFATHGAQARGRDSAQTHGAPALAAAMRNAPAREIEGVLPHLPGSALQALRETVDAEALHLRDALMLAGGDPDSGPEAPPAPEASLAMRLAWAERAALHAEYQQWQTLSAWIDRAYAELSTAGLEAQGPDQTYLSRQWDFNRTQTAVATAYQAHCAARLEAAQPGRPDRTEATAAVLDRLVQETQLGGLLRARLALENHFRTVWQALEASPSLDQELGFGALMLAALQVRDAVQLARTLADCYPPAHEREQTPCPAPAPFVDSLSVRVAESVARCQLVENRNAFAAFALRAEAFLVENDGQIARTPTNRGAAQLLLSHGQAMRAAMHNCLRLATKLMGNGEATSLLLQDLALNEMEASGTDVPEELHATVREQFASLFEMSDPADRALGLMYDMASQAEPLLNSDPVWRPMQEALAMLPAPHGTTPDPRRGLDQLPDDQPIVALARMAERGYDPVFLPSEGNEGPEDYRSAFVERILDADAERLYCVHDGPLGMPLPAPSPSFPGGAP